CSGSAAALGDALRVVRRRGTVVAVGFYQGDSAGLRLGEEFHHNGVEIRSGQIGNLHPSFDSRTLRARSLELALSGRVVLGGLPRLEVPVDDAGTGFAALLNRISAEAKAGGEQQIGLVGIENGEFAQLVAAGAFEDVTKVADKHKDQRIPQDMLTLGKFGGSAQVYIPWMQATYFMVASKQALQYLPTGADVNALTYQQTIAWAKNIFDKTGQKKFGFPLATDGLIHRLIQGYVHPSYTGGLVTTYKSADAATMWNDMKELWKYSNPQSTTYARLQEPLQPGDIWLGIDHVARLIDVLKAKPDGFVAVPAPSGPAPKAASSTRRSPTHSCGTS